AVRMVTDSMIQRYVESPVTHIGAIDARGFLLGAVLAYELNKPLVLFRKAGKLPADCVSAAYSTEYGEARIEVHRDALTEGRSEEHTSELQSRENLVCRLLLEKKKLQILYIIIYIIIYN